jgi:hypothetical protein
MNPRRLLTLGPDNEPRWVCLYVHQIGEAWATMIVADDALPPEPGAPKGLGFFGATREEVEEAVKRYLARSEPMNRAIDGHAIAPDAPDRRGVAGGEGEPWQSS